MIDRVAQNRVPHFQSAFSQLFRQLQETVTAAPRVSHDDDFRLVFAVPQDKFRQPVKPCPPPLRRHKRLATIIAGGVDVNKQMVLDGHAVEVEY